MGGPREHACAGLMPGAFPGVPSSVPLCGNPGASVPGRQAAASLGLFSSPNVIDRGLSEGRWAARSQELSGFNFGAEFFKGVEEREIFI